MVSVSNRPRETSPSSLLKSYYYLRFAIAAVWSALAFTIAAGIPALAAVMLVAYPAWDAVANLLDARRSGGLDRNRSQMLNMVVSIVAAISVCIALARSVNAVLAVYAVWAALTGFFQLLTGVRRWRVAGAQWAMILSGAQSILAGGFMVRRAESVLPASINQIAPYAAFGAFYFLVSAMWLTVREHRTGSGQVHA